jgi:hypothetical protein
MKIYDWVRITRTGLEMKNITLVKATITEYPHGLVGVTGLQSICTGLKFEDEFPLKEKSVELSPYNPLRLLGVKTKKIMVPNIPKSYSYDYSYPIFNGGVKTSYVKYEYQKRTYRVNPVWLETSSEGVNVH